MKNLCEETQAPIKITQRKIANTKQFIKGRALKVGEWAGPEVATALGLQGSFLFM